DAVRVQRHRGHRARPAPPRPPCASSTTEALQSQRRAGPALMDSVPGRGGDAPGHPATEGLGSEPESPEGKASVRHGACTEGPKTPDRSRVRRHNVNGKYRTQRSLSRTRKGNLDLHPGTSLTTTKPS
ncbi:unnamed protein product, partial [Rangifer tarandus platyrhynchus]